MPPAEIRTRSGFMFQSAPDREAGRCRSTPASLRGWKRFNPRPTVRPGDAIVFLVAIQQLPVSIRARP